MRVIHLDLLVHCQGRVDSPDSLDRSTALRQRLTSILWTVENPVPPRRGGTGGHVLAEAARRHHQTTAFTRRPHLLADASALAAVVTGDGRDPDAIASAVTGADAVIAIIAAASRTGPHHAAEVAQVLTTAMASAGVRRLVITSAYPIVAHKPRLPMALLRRLFADAYADTAEMEKHVTASDLDWTIVRLNRLTDQAARGHLTLSRELLARPAAITRADAAVALLDLATTGHHIRAAVNVSGQ